MTEEKPGALTLDEERVRTVERLTASAFYSAGSYRAGERSPTARQRDAGVFYTPAPVAWFICCRAVEGWLLRRCAEAGGELFASIDELLRAGTDVELDRAGSLLASVRLLDSSCGTGNFLEAAFEELCLLRGMIDAGKGVAPDFSRLRSEVLTRSLYGLDIDAASLDVARNRLRSLVGGRALPNLKKANVLLGEGADFLRGGFDVVVGNPPYMRVKNMFRSDEDPAGRKKELAKLLLKTGFYRFQEGNLNLYKLFLERNLQLVREAGSMGLIVPSSFLNEATSARLRQELFRACHVEEIVEVPEGSRLFAGVSQATAILIGHKGAPAGDLRLRFGADAGSLDGKAITIRIPDLSEMTGGRMEVPILTNPGLEWAMLTRLVRHPPFKGDESTREVGCITVGSLDETLDREFIAREPTGDLLVKGIHLREYAVDLSPEGPCPRWVRKQAFLTKRPAAAVTIALPRIIGRNTLNKACSRRLKFALLPAGYVCSNSIKQIVVTDPSIRPQYLLALLNSAVLNWYFEIFCSQNNIRNYAIASLPIPRASHQIQESIEAIAGMIMACPGKRREFLDRDLMDSLVYEEYFLGSGRLSSAVKAAVEEDADPAALEMRDDIREIVREIKEREGFQRVQCATYRQKSKEILPPADLEVF